MCFLHFVVQVCWMIADDRDDADDLRCNASDRIAGLQDRLTCYLQKRSSSGNSLVFL